MLGCGRCTTPRYIHPLPPTWREAEANWSSSSMLTRGSSSCAPSTLTTDSGMEISVAPLARRQARRAAASCRRVGGGGGGAEAVAVELTHQGV